MLQSNIYISTDALVKEHMLQACVCGTACVVDCVIDGWCVYLVSGYGCVWDILNGNRLSEVWAYSMGIEFVLSVLGILVCICLSGIRLWVCI
jgi:hypothetical protein